MEYPKSVLARSQKGKLEARVLSSTGRFVEYEYRDPKTDQKIKGGKRKICLRDEKGNTVQYMVIPLKGARSLLIKPKDQKVEGKEVWNPKEERVEGLKPLLGARRKL